MNLHIVVGKSRSEKWHNAESLAMFSHESYAESFVAEISERRPLDDWRIVKILAKEILFSWSEVDIIVKPQLFLLETT